MKKWMVLALALLLCLTACFSDGEKTPAERYDHLIQVFETDPFNDQTLEVGETDTPTSAVWLESPMPFIARSVLREVRGHGNRTAGL